MKHPFATDVESTTIDPDEKSELIPQLVNTRIDINQLEHDNIARALTWLYKQKIKSTSDLLNTSFALKLHEKMFEDVWRWAGKFRTTDKNIGINWQQLPTQLENLFSNTNYQIKNKTYNKYELAARFHHRLVQIHAFCNGNGRHARIMTEHLFKLEYNKKLSWGHADSSCTRRIYIYRHSDRLTLTI